jgi:hypothetical protein
MASLTAMAIVLLVISVLVMANIHMLQKIREAKRNSKKSKGEKENDCITGLCYSADDGSGEPFYCSDYDKCHNNKRHTAED